MILNDNTGKAIDGGLSECGRVIKYTIDDADVGMVMDIIANRTYTKKILAVVREYICNAWDAHIEANKTDVPFVVTCPTALEPTFKVRDFGMGMSEEDIERIYVKIAKSTKRQSNSVIGSYGIGAKAAFCYSDSFTVISWNNGIKSQYVAQIDGQKMARMIPLFKTPSDEPNGIEISVSVKSKDAAEFKREILSVCALFPTTPTMINVEPSEVIPLKKKLEGSCWYISGDSLQRSYGYGYGNSRGPFAVCGNVRYEISSEYLSALDGNLFLDNIHFVFDIGSVDIPPSRESLEYTPRTIEQVNKIIKAYQKEMPTVISERLKDAKDIFEAISFIPEPFRNSQKKFVWNGVEVLKAIDPDSWHRFGSFFDGRMLVRSNGKWVKERYRRFYNLGGDIFKEGVGKIVIIIKDEFKLLKRRMQNIPSDIEKIYVVDNVRFYETVKGEKKQETAIEYLNQNVLFDKWPEGVALFTSNIEPAPLVKKPREKGRVKSADYCPIMSSGAFGVLGDFKIEDGKKVVYVPIFRNSAIRGKTFYEPSIFSSIKRDTELPTDTVFIGLRVGKVRSIPKDFVLFDRWIVDFLNNRLKGFTREDIGVVENNYSSYRGDKFLKRKLGILLEIEDTVAQTIKLIADRFHKNCDELSNILGTVRVLRGSLEKIKEVLGDDPALKELCEKIAVVEEDKVENLIGEIISKFPMLEFVRKGGYDDFGVDKNKKSVILEYIKERQKVTV